MQFIGTSEKNREFAKTLQIPAAIHGEDFIFRHLERKWVDLERSVSSYYEGGRYSAALLKTFVDDIKRVKGRLGQSWEINSFLDFASGYGCVARHLKNYFPSARIVAADIHDKAVNFNKNELGVDSLLSSDEPETTNFGQYDIVIALSFFSHMPVTSFERWLNALVKSVRPGGALLFTANGYATHTIAGFRINLNEEGFGFTPASEQRDLDAQTYGATISMPRFVLSAINRLPGVRLHAYREAIWWNIQDAYVCIRDE